MVLSRADVMADLLRFVVFTPELLDLVRDFDYGNEPYQKELADWMRNEAVTALERGTKVWRYIKQADELVGYSSLGVTRWTYPDPSSRQTELVVIPVTAYGVPERQQP